MLTENQNNRNEKILDKGIDKELKERPFLILKRWILRILKMESMSLIDMIWHHIRGIWYWKSATWNFLQIYPL